MNKKTDGWLFLFGPFHFFKHTSSSESNNPHSSSSSSSFFFFFINHPSSIVTGYHSLVWTKVIEQAYNFCKSRMETETEIGLTMIFHHGGDLVKFGSNDLQYIGGQMCVWDKLEADFLNKFDLESMVRNCGRYFNISHIWYLLPEMTMLDDLRKLVNDKDFMDMVSVAKDNNNEIELFFEHGVEVFQCIEPEVEVQDEAEVEVQVEPGVEVQGSDADTEVEC
ncbi:hypothetical protein TSUD_185210 [Trifolium subterraneum]|uniref:PB1-like domain-containing protein n=1 Tax=Trifolium subterraneum TaxID=3900 RepID=A0A2Z6P3V0_TRISU|nr:hypothetical protein TSUD_185210 [Trifolium subterraneum]